MARMYTVEVKSARRVNSQSSPNCINNIKAIGVPVTPWSLA
jgi:hypothetical protein